MDVSDAKRLRQLEEENARLENGGRAGAGHFHPQECPLKKLPRPVSCREVVRYVQTTYAASQQRACATLGVNAAMSGLLPTGSGCGLAPTPAGTGKGMAFNGCMSCYAVSVL